MFLLVLLTSLSLLKIFAKSCSIIIANIVLEGEENSLNKRNDFNRLIFAHTECTVDRKNLRISLSYKKVHLL